MKAPDLIFIDVILIAYRLGHLRHEEQKTAMLAAARAATDAITFLSALNNFGIGQQTRLHQFAGQYMAAPEHMRARYPAVLGLHPDGEAPPPFLNNTSVLFYVEPILTLKQQQLFYDVYWSFTHNYQPTYFDAKKGLCIGNYANKPKDNDSVLANFEDYIYRLTNHPTQRIRQRFEGLPADILLAILKRAFSTR